MFPTLFLYRESTVLKYWWNQNPLGEINRLNFCRVLLFLILSKCKFWRWKLHPRHHLINKHCNIATHLYFLCRNILAAFSINACATQSFSFLSNLSLKSNALRFHAICWLAGNEQVVKRSARLLEAATLKLELRKGKGHESYLQETIINFSDLKVLLRLTDFLLWKNWRFPI